MKTEKIKQELLRMINEVDAEEENYVSLSDIMKTYKPHQCFDVLSELIQHREIVLLISRRHKRDIYFKPGKSRFSEALSSLDETELLNDLAELYNKMYPTESIHSFSDAVSPSLRKNPVLKFIMEENGDLLDFKIISRCIRLFFEGEGSVGIHDLLLNKNQILEIIDRINQKKFIPVQQELLEACNDMWGFQLRGGLNQRIIKLLKNEPLQKFDTVKKKNGNRFYFDVSWEDIKPCTLYYNKPENDLFEGLTKLMTSDHRKSIPSLSVLLHGKPGTGKTEFAYQLARNIQADIMHLNFSQIHSKYVGDTEKNIRTVFEEYRKKCSETDRPVILLLNEADGLMNKRVNVYSCNDSFHNHAQTQLLEILEDFGGIVIATTNLFQNVDEAFYRRFLYKHEIGLPGRQTKELIIQNSKIADYISEDTFQTLLESEWSPADLKNVEKKIQQLELVQVMDDRAIENLLYEDGLLQKKQALGFMQKKNACTLTN